MTSAILDVSTVVRGPRVITGVANDICAGCGMTAEATGLAAAGASGAVRGCALARPALTGRMEPRAGVAGADASTAPPIGDVILTGANRPSAAVGRLAKDMACAGFDAAPGLAAAFARGARPGLAAKADAAGGATFETATTVAS